MGVEWSLGCLKCKTFLWLGSQKPFKWNGFQISNESVKRFLAMHSNLKSPQCHLFLINDGTREVPWEENSEWKEDILSRNFCYDSYSPKGLICGSCEILLSEWEKKTESPLIPANDLRKSGKIQKNEYLWFCDPLCFQKYLQFQSQERETFLYDSTEEPLGFLEKYHWDIGCTQCKEYQLC
jgi:hypothetical protein